MFSWFREMDRNGRRTFWVCFGGFALDAMDVHIYSFAAPVLISLWALSYSDAGLLATVALVSSAVGGWAAGLLADRIGRVRTLQITILWFSVFTFLSGFTADMSQLMVTRGLQGLGFGGEWAAGSVLMGEVVRARHRGRAVGMVQSAWAIGWGLAALASTAVFVLLPPEIGWRILFFIGVLPALAIFAVRRYAHEPDLVQRGRPQPVLAIFKGRFAGVTSRACLLTVGIHGGYYALATWLPTFLLRERNLSVLNTGGYLAVIVFGSFCGYVAGAYLNDGIGRRKTVLAFAVCSLAIVLAYTRLPISNGVMLILGFPLGFFAAGIFSGIGALLTELYPTELRGSGQGFSYSAGRGVAGLAPLLVGGAAGGASLGSAIGLYACGAYGLVILAILMLPETRGRPLTSLADDGPARPVP